jgi:hypothetical protein
MKKENFDFKTYYSSEENIDGLLKAMKLNDYEFGGIKNTYTINDNRFAFGMFVKNKNSGKLLSIYVDAIQGYPCWDQCMDAAFNLGQDYDKRVILFSEGKENPKSLNNIDVVENFIGVINNSGLETYFIQANNSGKNNPEEPLEYFVLTYPADDKKSASFKKLPTKIDFHWARFKIIFCEIMGNEEYLCDDIDIGKGHYGYPVTGFKIEKVWDENGGFINAVLDSDKQSDLDILNKYYEELKIRIPDYTIEFIMDGDKVKGVSVKILDIPFSEFVLNINDAEGRVDDFKAHEWGFTSLIDDISVGGNRENWEEFYFVDHK